MSVLYLTPASIGYLTQFILAAAIAGYFWYQSRRQPSNRVNHSLSTLLLAAAFTCFTCAILLLFLNASLRPDLTFYVMPLESVAVALFLAFLLQFAYHFPHPVPDQQREAQVVLGLSILYVLAESRIAIRRYAMLTQGHVIYRPEVADFPLFVGFLWVAIVLLRHTVHTSTDGPGASAWRKLWRPRGRAARAARALALLSILPLGFEVIELLKAYLLLPQDLSDLVQSLGILFALSAFALVYLNYLPDTTSLLVKLVGVSLATLLAVLGSVGWILSPSIVSAYHDDGFITDQTTLRFAPNQQGGYDVASVPFSFDNAFGKELAAGDVWRQLGFDFPFYDQVWREAYVSEDGVISFGQIFDSQDVKYRYGTVPAIFPLHLDLTLDTADQSGSAGLFARQATDRLTFTWYRLPQTWDRDTRYTFQLVLYPTGVFEITFNGLPAARPHAIQEPRDAAWVIGAVPGTPQSTPHPIRFTADLPFFGGGAGIVEDYYLDLRHHLHHLFLPLAYLVIGSSLLIVVGFPIFFRLNLLNPLNNLLKGIRQLNAGNLGQTMVVKYHDEIGVLTQSFNNMAAELRSRTQTSRRRATELQALTRVSSTLRESAAVEDMAAILVEETVDALGGEAGAILLLEDDTLVVTAVHELPQTLLGHRLPFTDIPCGPTLQAGELALSELVESGMCATCGLCQMLAQGAWHSDPVTTTQQTLAKGRRIAVVPLQAADQPLGLLQVAFEQPGTFSVEKRRLLVSIAEIGGNALQRAQTMNLLEQLVEDRTRELAALYAVTRTTTRHRDLQIVLPRVLDKALEVVGGEAGIIHLLDPSGETMYPAVQRGITPGLRARAEDRPDRDRSAQSNQDWSGSPSQNTNQKGHDPIGTESDLLSVWEQVVEQGETTVMQISADAEPHTVTLRGGPNYVGVPLYGGQHILGVLSIFGGKNKDFSVEDIALLASLADNVGAAVESAQLRQQAQDTAVKEERRRLARDLHDSVTQSLHSLVLSADTANYLLEQDRTEPLTSSLHRLGDSARQALKEMRLLLYELRLAPLEEMNLVEVLQARLESVEQRAGIEAELVVEGAANWPRAWEGELYCIAMEALNNALRHARATEVSVSLQGRRDGVTLEVTDNGRGFDPHANGVGGMGLHNMAERARRLGGELTVDSAPGAGTRIRVSIETG